jgi:arabinofuranosyltransferase
VRGGVGRTRAPQSRRRHAKTKTHTPSPRSESRASPVLFPLIVIAAALGGVILFLVREKAIAGSWGFSLDDSWIHAVFARNIATGHGFSFNPDEPVAGSTGPLYSAILAALYWATGQMIWSAKIFGILCHATSALLIYRAALRLDSRERLAALLAGTLVAVSPSLVWASVSGMEISLYLLFVCLGIHEYASGRSIRASAVWAAGVWVRPDGLFLVALSLIGPISQLWRKLVVVAAVLAGYFAFNLAIGHELFPQTVGTKAHFGLHLTTWTMNLLREWGALWGIPYRPSDQLEHPALLFPLMLLGAVLTARRRPLLALYWIGLPLAFSLFREHSASHKRYILYVIPVGMMLASAGAAWLGRRLAPRMPQRAVAGLGGICLLWQLVYLDHKATNHGWNVQNINGMQIVLGEIAERVTPPGGVVGASDIGAIGYFSHRRVVDLVGLVNKRRPLPENLSLYRPTVIIVDMGWFKPYARPDPASGYYAFYDADSTHKYTILGAAELHHNTIASTSMLVMLMRQGLHDPPIPDASKFKISS